MSWVSSRRSRALLALALPLVAADLGRCAPGGEAYAPPPEPKSVRGVLRVSAFGSEARAGGPAPLRHRTLWVNDTSYAGMEDNDLRGFLDGRFQHGWNQPTQGHVRAGRRPSSALYGEFELFRSLYRWSGIRLPPAAGVQRARIAIAIEKGPERPLDVMLYEVKKDWNPGEGGTHRDNTSPPARGEVWWRDRAYGVEPWGLPGVGFASDGHPAADTGAMPLAEARWEPGQAELVFESGALAAYAEGRVRAGQPLLFLLKLADRLEDTRDTLLSLYSGNVDDDRNTERRPRLLLEWESPAELAALEREVHLEHGRSLVLEAPGGRGAALLAASFLPAEGHEAPALEARPAGGSAAWGAASRPLATAGEALALRVLAARSPLVRGDVFRAGLRDTWVKSAPPEEQRVVWTFLAPGGARHPVEARYRGDFRWEVEFEPRELGRWGFYVEHRLDKPYRSPLGVFDLLPGDREDVVRQLRDLLERIRAADPDPRTEGVADFGQELWRLERAAMQNETPESFHSESGRALYDLLSEVRQALSEKKVPDVQKPKAGRRDG